MLGYPAAFNTSSNENYGQRFDHSSADPSEWVHSTLPGTRSNLFFDVNSYPPAVKASMSYANVPSSFSNDVAEAANEQIGARWSAHYQADAHSLNSSFFGNAHHPVGQGVANGFSTQINGSRPDALSGAAGMSGAGRGFPVTLAREGISNVDWPST